MMKLKFSALFAALYAALFAFTGNAFATTLYGYNSNGQLIVIDPSTASTTPIGSSGPTIVGLTHSTLTNTTYARSFNALFSVNLATGAKSTIGSSGSFLTGLTFNGAQNLLFSVDQGSGDLFAINIATGTPTLIGSTGMSSLLDLATDSNGNVFAAHINGGVYQVNTTTAALTLVSNVSDGLTSIAFSSTGDLYGVSLNGDRLYRGILTTPTVVGPLSPNYSDVRGLEFVGNAVAAVPEPATWAVMLIGFGAIGGAMRRRSATTKASRMRLTYA